jgi:hypothetical protein
MADTAFAVHLCGNIYLDSNGNLIQGAPEKAPVYNPPFQLPVEPSKVKDSLDSVKKALKDINRDADVIKKFEDFGLPLKILDILSGVGKIAGMVAPVFMVASFVVDALKLFGVFKSGPSSLELLVRQRFDELETTVQSLAQLIVSQDLRNGRIDVENFSNAVKTYVAQLKNTNPTLAQLEADQIMLFGLHEQHIDGISKLLDQQTWLSVFDRTKYTQVWGPLAFWLYTLPQDIIAPRPAPLPAQGTPHFDHRLMVPLASMAAETYLACLRGISPEYRSTGDFRDQLRGLAQKLDGIAQAMRENCLARTIYKPSDFAWPVLVAPYDVVWTGIFPGAGEPVISPKCSRWPVGALDLLYHDDAFFREFLDSLWKGEFFGWPHETKHAGINLRWIPPAKLEQAEFGNWRITNPEECAAAANAQAGKDYADLLSVSGYTDLLQLAALFHHESTEPDRSQTVQPQKPFLYRDPQPSSPTTVSSDDIFLTGVITSNATREPQKCMASATVWTQPIKRPRPVEYQVRLRTLHSLSGKNRWHETTYDQFQWAQYEQDPANPGFFRLEITHAAAALDDALLLPGWRSSPRDAPLHTEGTVNLKAHTFDWWIPVKWPFSAFGDFKVIAAELRGAGGFAATQLADGASGLSLDLLRRNPSLVETIAGNQARLANEGGAGATQIMSNGDLLDDSLTYKAGLRDLIPELFWKNGDQDWDGQHRDVQEATIKVDYKLDWEADRLYVTLHNDPADRDYVVYLVLEEKFIGTGQIMHTALPIPVNGQLTYVPQKFFNDESAAMAKAAKAIAEFNRRFSKSHQPRPIDPIVGWLNPGDVSRHEVVARFLEVAREKEPELLAEVMQINFG